MAVSAAYRRAIKDRKQRSRRIQVAFFFGFLAWGLADAGTPWTWANRGMLMPYLAVAALDFVLWKRQRYVPVSSLDDRAMAEYGVEFEQATQAQQRQLLDKYRVGTYLLNYFPDEFEEAQDREWHLRAYAVLRVVLPMLGIVYWAGWKLIPDGRLRAGWTDAPVVFAWILLLILVLPRLLRMWLEPDDPIEPKLTLAAREEA